MSDTARVVFATFRPRPDQVDALASTLRTMVDHTRREPGCEVYDLYRSDDEVTRFHLFERYRDDDALAAHRASDHYQAYRAQLPDLLEDPVEVAVLSAIDAAG